MVRHELCQPVNLTIAHLQHASGIFQHRARLQSPKSDDLRDMVTAIFTLNVTDHFLTPRFTEIDVEVGHRDA